ncbi:MAG: hypothetical protein V1779_09880 [bacterium]
MKNLMVFISLIIVFLTFYSCESPLEFDDLETVTFINQTEYKINVTIDSDIIETNIKSFSVNPEGNTKIKSEYGIVPIFNATVEGSSLLKVNYYEGDASVTFDRVYEYTVEYKISGTAIKVDVTLNNSSGGTEQYDDVTLPHSYQYRSFNDNFVYISAQNQGQSGSVTVSIYHKGILFKTSTSSGAYVIATASGSI